MALKVSNTLSTTMIYRLIAQPQAHCCLLALQPALCGKKYYFLPTEEKLSLRETKGTLRDDKDQLKS